MNETKQLARFVSEIKFSDLNSEVIAKVKGLVLDQLGCQLAFAILPWNKGVYKYIRSKNQSGASTVTYYGLKTSAEEAAFVNSVFGHGFEMDDSELISASHPGSVVIPPALAISESEVVSGKEFITAVVIGYDVMLRIGMSNRAMIARSFDTTSTTGVFGSTAATGKILGFDTDMLVNAFSIAADQACGTGEFSCGGGMVKRLHAAFAAQAGIKSALLAKYGIIGPVTAIEGERGFCRAFSGENAKEETTSGLGKDFKIMLTGNKPYCCCAAQNSVIDATDALIQKNNIKPEEVAEITVLQKPQDVGVVGSIIEPNEIVSAQFSARFGIALRMVKGSNSFKDYVESNLKDPRILEIIRKIKYVSSGKDDKGSPATVTITLNKGISYEEHVDYARGTWQNPMLWPGLESKFRSLVKGVIPDQKMESIIEIIKDLEELDDIQKLTSLLKVSGEK